LNFNTTRLLKASTRIHFNAITKWIVFTGPPSSGKSTTLKALSKLGYKCEQEIARSYFEDNPRIDEVMSQREIILQKLALENSLNCSEQIFLDRGMPDSITYYRTCGISPYEAITYSTKYKYIKVFIFEGLPLTKDGIRTENKKQSVLIRKWLEIDYAYLGYEVISVPVDTVNNRINYILKKI